MIRRTKPRGNEEGKETKKDPVLKFSDTQLIASGAASHRNVFSALADTSVEMIDVDIGGDHSGEVCIHSFLSHLLFKETDPLFFLRKLQWGMVTGCLSFSRRIICT